MLLSLTRLHWGTQLLPRSYLPKFSTLFKVGKIPVNIPATFTFIRQNFPEAYSKPSQISKYFVQKIIKDFQLSFTLTKSSVLGVWLYSGYVSEIF